MTRRAPEKAVERQGDQLMAAFGFTAIRFSQARATMQTCGIPDRRYYRWARDPIGRLVVHTLWWEAKAGTKQSAYQRAFQQLAEVCGETYVLGGVEALEEYLIRGGLARRLPNGLEALRWGRT